MQNVLVVGGSGFLGFTIVEDLIKRGNLEVSVLDVRKAPEFDTVLQGKLKNFFSVDLTNKEALRDALTSAKIDTIFHTATPSPFAPPEILRKVNVDGTRALVEVCKECGVKRLILTSSSSVVYSGQDILDMDESAPYATTGYNVYTDTKIEQEKIVLAAHSDTFATCALRPSSIYGPRDALLLPQMYAAAKQGRMKFKLGSGKNLYSFTFVRNCSFANLLAADKLASADNSAINGQAFFINNDVDTPFWDFASDLCFGAAGYRPTITIPYPVIFTIVFVLELLCKFLRVLGINVEPPTEFTYDKLAYLTSNRTFKCDKAKKLLGYKPPYTEQEGLKLGLEYFHKNPPAIPAGRGMGKLFLILAVVMVVLFSLFFRK